MRSASTPIKESSAGAQLAAAFVINTYAYTQGGSVTECLNHLAELDCRAVELMVYPGHLWPAELDTAARRELRQLLEGRSMRLASLNMPNIDINIAAAAAEMRAYSLQLLSRFLELAGDLEAEVMIIGPGKPNPLFPAPRKELTGHFYRALDHLCILSEKVGTELLVENMPFAFLPDAESMTAAIEQYGNDRIGICYDVANAHFIGEDLGTGLRGVRDRLRLIHLSDTGQQVYRHDPIGQGTVPFKDVPNLLNEVGYRGASVLEIISSTPDEDMLEGGRRLIAMGWPPSGG